VSLSLKELAVRIGAELRGDAAVRVDRVASIDTASQGSVAFLSDARYKHNLQSTGASAVIVSPELASGAPCAVLVMANPYLGYARAAQALHPRLRPEAGVHSTSVIDATARVPPSAVVGPHCVIEAEAVLEKGVELGPGCVIGARSRIGEDSRLVARVTICAGTQIGRRVVIQPGAVIGSDGFGFAPDGDRWEKIPQLGRVVIGDDVEIGANTTIDRGALQDTVIESGAKLDNLIQVAHNVRIGSNTVMAGCVGIAGSAKIGSNCMIGGGVGIAGHLEVPDRVTVTGMTLVSKSLPGPGVYSSGLPAQPNKSWNRILARLFKIDDLFRKIADRRSRADDKD
jgi:UDP-3-O-[3-hydroxymyristoyl] glucosamine N-acyltransferase